MKEIFSSLRLAYKVAIFLVFLGVAGSMVLTLRSHFSMQEANTKVKEAKEFLRQATSMREEAARISVEARKIEASLQKANKRAETLQVELDKIKIPLKPTRPPESIQAIIADLRGMGLDLVVKPSSSIAPAVAGITAKDASSIWGWGKENLRVPGLEQKVEKQGELIVGLREAKVFAENLAEKRLEQANVSMNAANLHKHEAEAITEALKQTRKAMKADTLKRKLYVGGAIVGGYFVGRKLKPVG